jgi:hypothetical protein
MGSRDHNLDHRRSHLLQGFQDTVLRRGWQGPVRRGWVLLPNHRMAMVEPGSEAGTVAAELGSAGAAPGLAADAALAAARVVSNGGPEGPLSVLESWARLVGVGLEYWRDRPPPLSGS